MEEINWSEKEPHPFKQRQRIKTFTPEEIERAKELAKIATRRKMEERKKQRFGIGRIPLFEKLKLKIKRKMDR